jgi:protein involved in polysaccharide export with SLBB domain
MKRKLASLFLALSGLVAAAQTSEPAKVTPRDPAGFLPIPAIPAETSPILTPAPNVPAISNPTNPPATNSTATDSSYVLDDKYKLMPGDSVSILIKEDRTNAVPLLVAESSELDIPYIGRLNVSGRTCKQLAAEVKALLEKDYYHRATVIIGLNQRSKVLGSVYVFGPVRQPGQVLIPSGETFTAGKAIVRAQGFMDFADKKNVKVVRKTATGSTTFKVNMVNVLEKGKTDEDITLEPEDFIIVPKSPFNF